MNPNQSKQLILQGHSRPIKDLEFSQKGDFIYSGSNDRNVVCWNATTGEKVKTFPHSAAVNIIALTSQADIMITGDNTGGVYIWGTRGGVLLKHLEEDATLCVRAIQLSTDDSLLMILYAGRMKGAASFINVYRLADVLQFGMNEESESSTKNQKSEKSEKYQKSQKSEKSQKLEYSNKSGKIKVHEKEIPIQKVEPSTIPAFKKFECTAGKTKWVQAKFATMNKSIIVSREDGYLELINFGNSKVITQNKFHDDVILDFDYNYGLILTASRDGTACVINFDTFQEIKKFHPQNPTRNLNACCLAKIQNPDYSSVTVDKVDVNTINDVNNLFSKSVSSQLELVKIDVDNLFNDEESPIEAKSVKREIIIAVLSGGQDSKLVTTTNQKEGGFEILLYDAIDGQQMGNFLTHFGPVNTLAVSNDTLASGAEDATVRIYKIQNYLFPIDKNK